MEARGWTAYAWAQQAHLSEATIANLVRRKARGARPSTLSAMATSAGVEFDWLARGVGPSGLGPAPSPPTPELRVERDEQHIPEDDEVPLETALFAVFAEDRRGAKRYTTADFDAARAAIRATHRKTHPNAALDAHAEAMGAAPSRGGRYTRDAIFVTFVLTRAHGVFTTVSDPAPLHAVGPEDPMPTTTCTRCDAETAPESDLCHAHDAERARYGEHPTACICWGCAKWFPRPTGIKALYLRTAEAPLALVSSLRAVVRDAADRAAQNALADARREAVCADLAALDADAMEMPWTLAWNPRASALVPAVGT